MFNTLFKIWITTALAALVWFGYTSHKNQNGAFSAPSLPTFDLAEKSKGFSFGKNPFKSSSLDKKVAITPNSPIKSASLEKGTPKSGNFFSKFSDFTKKKSKTAKNDKAKLNLAYTAAFPEVLRQNNWVISNAGLPACKLKPSDTYSFANRQNSSAGIGCHLVKSGAYPTYQCQTKSGRRKRTYTIEPGHKLLGMDTIDRPHITLSDVKRPSRKFSLKLC